MHVTFAFKRIAIYMSWDEICSIAPIKHLGLQPQSRSTRQQRKQETEKNYNLNQDVILISSTEGVVCPS